MNGSLFQSSLDIHDIQNVYELGPPNRHKGFLAIVFFFKLYEQTIPIRMASPKTEETYLIAFDPFGDNDVLFSAI